MRVTLSFNRIKVLIKKKDTPEISLTLLPCEDIGKKKKDSHP
jgi:hypothetical protein